MSRLIEKAFALVHGLMYNEVFRVGKGHKFHKSHRSFGRTPITSRSETIKWVLSVQVLVYILEQAYIWMIVPEKFDLLRG
jgi:hypothetical protein